MKNMSAAKYPLGSTVLIVRGMREGTEAIVTAHGMSAKGSVVYHVRDGKGTDALYTGHDLQWS